MWTKERNIIFSIIATVITFGVYLIYASDLLDEGKLNGTPKDLGWLIVYLIIGGIILQILASILSSIAGGVISGDEDDASFMDERDKKFETRASQIGTHVLAAIFFIAVIGMIRGNDPALVIHHIVLAFGVSAMVELLTQLFFYLRDR